VDLARTETVLCSALDLRYAVDFYLGRSELLPLFNFDSSNRMRERRERRECGMDEYQLLRNFLEVRHDNFTPVEEPTANIC
jgi:hypothetical protein